MTILLTVLKVIGIILLVILGILLAGVLLVLFVPVRYRAEGEYLDRFTAKGQVTWLLHLLSVRFSFENGLQYSVKIAGIRILPRRVKKKSSDTEIEQASETEKAFDPETEKAPETEKDTLSDTTNPDEVPKTQSSDRILEKPQAKAEEKKASEADAAGTKRTSETTGATGLDEDESALLSLCDKLFQKINAIFRKYREKYEAICAKIKQIQDKLSYYIRILKREETKELLRLIIDQLQGIFRHVLPRKLDVRLHIGTGDPASTGQILALQGMLYPILRGNVRIVPDFEEKHLEGTFSLKGRITAFVLLICALRVIINKNFRKLIRILRKKEEA